MKFELWYDFRNPAQANSPCPPRNLSGNETPIQTGYLSVGLPRFELGTFDPPDHRNLSRTSVWTTSARGFNDMCLTGTPVSVW